MATDYRRELTDKIITALENGVAPWQKPWDGSVVKSMQPFNPISSTQYRGFNQLSLMMTPYDDPRWCTYKQAAEKGWQVRKGEKSTSIEFWKFYEDREQTDPDSGEVKKVKVKLDRPIVRYASVFNVQQMDNVPELERIENGYEWEPNEMAEKILSKSGVPMFFDQSDRAYYTSLRDEIHMPAREAFPSVEKFYATALHELGHATGHESRLNRKLGNTFGSVDYAKEELRAEMASFFLSARLGIEFDVGNHAAYVGSWIKVLQEDKNELFRAAKDAEGIAEYVMNIGLEKALVKSAETENSVAARDGNGAALPTSEKLRSSGMGERTYINVPFAEKEEAKKLGAKWDKARVSWYVPETADKALFGKWMGMLAVVNSNDFITQFANDLREKGLVLDGMPIMDGKWHRAPVSTSSNAKALKGAYIGNLDRDPVTGADVANGFIQNFDVGVAQAWWPKGLTITNEQRERFEAQAAENKRVRDAELAAERASVAAAVEKKWDSLPDVLDHPYLARKGVDAFGLKVDGDRLVTPLRDIDGNLRSLQYIPANAEKPKMYEKGGQKTGNFHMLGSLEEAEVVLFAEGYATSASLHMATGSPVVEVFDSGNLEAVVRALKPKLGNRAIVICGDDDVLTEERIRSTLEKLVKAENNVGLKVSSIDISDVGIGGMEVRLKDNPDCKMVLDLESVVKDVPRVVGEITNEKTGYTVKVLINNVGREKATVVAEKLQGQAVFPDFWENHVHGQTDFNDLHKAYGLAEVRRQVGPVIERAVALRTPEGCVKALIGEHGVLEPAHDNKRYVGTVIANTAAHSVQNLGKSIAVAHELAKLDVVPAVGKSARIIYEGSRGKVMAQEERQNSLQR
jgi:putative DNA primase/helicase